MSLGYVRNTEYIDPLILNMAATSVANALQSRRDLFNRGKDTRRSIEDECGYCDPMSLSAKDFKDMYIAEPVAARVVQVLPLESWKISPTIYENQFGEETEFERQWNSLSSQLSGYSWSKQEEGSIIWNILQQADILSGIGRYGVILLGIDDGLPLDQPIPSVVKAFSPGAPPKPEVSSTPTRLLYLRSFDETQVPILAYEADKRSPRYGKPLYYSLVFESSDNSSGGQDFPFKDYKVHWSRVIHLADDSEGSETFGTPRQRPVYRRLQDLQKTYGGSAEMFWKGGFPGYSFETHPQLGGDVAVDDQEFKDMVEQWMNGLQRVIRTSGMSVKSLGTQVADPLGHINSQIEAICIQKGIPKRIFSGSERGDLASTQDSMAWNARLAGRQNRYLTPNLIVPFINRLILTGVLIEPKQYVVEWPDLNTLNPQEFTDRALKITRSLAEYIKGGVEAMIPPHEYLTYICDFTDEQAEAFIEASAKHMEDAPISDLFVEEEPKAGEPKEGKDKKEPEAKAEHSREDEFDKGEK